MTNLFTNFFVTLDAPRPWGLYFQDSASPQMEALIELHDNIMFYLVIILFGVAWILISVIRNYVNDRFPISNKYFNHGTFIELIWTITPALILILIAFPSFKLLYLMDEVTDPIIMLVDYNDFIFFNNDSSSGSEDGNNGSIGSNGSIDSNDVPDILSPVDQNIANCPHDHLQPYADTSLEAINNTPCDLNPTPLEDGTFAQHSAFVGGLSPVQCPNCFAIICRDCEGPGPDWDTDQYHSSPSTSDNSSDEEDIQSQGELPSQSTNQND